MENITHTGHNEYQVRPFSLTIFFNVPGVLHFQEVPVNRHRQHVQSLIQRNLASDVTGPGVHVRATKSALLRTG